MTNPGSINSGANPGGPLVPGPPGQVPLNATNLVDPTQSKASGVNTDSSQMSSLNSLISPPPLKTFIYAPAVRIIIAHNEIEYDISADLVRCSLGRPENSAATFFFTLHNKGLRYTPPSKAPFFSRMDRVVVYMKKTSWLQVFSGYLDQIPFKQLYPGTVDFKATCTIKRILHTWWDPALPKSASLLNQLNTPEVLNQGLTGDGSGANDSGLGTILRNILCDVGGWNVGNIHIQNFPTAFLQFMMTQLSQLNLTNAPNALSFQQMLLGSDTTPGPGAYAGFNANAGPPGPSAPTGVGAAGTGTAFYVSQIVAACDQRGLGPLVQDNTLSADLIQAGATGASGGNTMTDPGSQKAWQQVQQTGQSWQQANRNSDGAILGVACALAETGGGVAIRNLYNPSVPGSETFPNDGPGTDHSSVGIMQQQSQGWGTLPQRMNPMQAAGMFFAALAQINGWRNMDPGQAIQQVQQSGNASGAQYDAAISTATTLVQTYRTSQAGTASTVIPGGSATLGGTAVPQAASAAGAAAGGLGGAPSFLGNSVTAAASSTPAPAALASAVNPTSQGKPQPDSEGAINFAMTCLGLPYVWGGTGPAGYDCSGLVSQAFKSIGIAIGRTTGDIASKVNRVPTASVQRGDIVEPSSHHVVLWCGDGTIIEAQQTGVPLHRVPASGIGSPNSWYGVFRACANGGPDPTAPFNPPATMGPGNPPGALSQVSGVAGGSGTSGSTEGVARNQFGYLFTGQFASDTAGLFTGTKAFIEGQPLIQMVQAICSASLRCWSSAPNGDFMAWYPDYWGLDGKPAVLRLADIELKDVHINLSDEPLTTHVYINGDLNMSGTISDPIYGWLTTAGVATVEQPWLYARLIAAAPGDMPVASGQEIMRRFGIRPLQQSFAMAGTQQMEFLLACQVFMEQWGKQYQTTIQMTFMPELFPGMRVELPDRQLQVYVNAVSHSCDYEQGFTTSATISAPSNPQARALMSSVNTATLPNGGLPNPADAANIGVAP